MVCRLEGYAGGRLRSLVSSLPVFDSCLSNLAASRDEASSCVTKVSGSNHKGFSSYALAIERFRAAEARGTVRILPGPL